MNYATVCSGIDAPGTAWQQLGWRAVFHSEIEPFPCDVLAAREPDVPNLGNMEAITREQIEGFKPVSVFVAGTPCQSFSVAGLRKGMADPRGNLALVFLRLVDWLRPSWVVWENVPGVLSSDDGRAFGAFLGGLGQLGYGFAYRVLDAQHFGVPQRRRRVFVVGHLGDWRRAAAVLFERHSLSGHPAPSREAGARTAACFTAGAHPGGHNGQDDHKDGRLIPVIILEAGKRCGLRNSARDGTGIGVAGDPMFTLQSGAQHAVAYEPIPIDMRQASRGATMTNNRSEGACSGGAPGTGVGEPGDPSPSLSASHPPAVTFSFVTEFSNQNIDTDLAGTMHRRSHSVASSTSGVRRLMPIECERLQGFPDSHTAVKHRGKPAADAPRYKAIGNSMAVPVLLWIGRRIEAVHKMEAHP